MSLLDIMSEGNSFQKVHVKDIRPNVNNFYAHIDDNDEEQYVSDMAKQLKEYGQDSNAVVYYDISPNDGKKYTLLAGERRWKAASLNWESGIGDGMVQVKIIEKPEDETQELLRIISNNSQRDKSKDVRKAEIDALEFCWQDLKERGLQPPGKKRDWIAQFIGLSPRRVQDYLSTPSSESLSVQEDAVDFEVPEDTQEELTSAELDTLKTIQNNLKESIGRKVKISKKCAITFYPQNNHDMEDLFTILDDLGFTEEGYWK